jgi:hypothetical protein
VAAKETAAALAAIRAERDKQDTMWLLPGQEQLKSVSQSTKPPLFPTKKKDAQLR